MRTLTPKMLGHTLIVLATAVALTACASTQREDPKTGAVTATQQWDEKIKVTAYPDEVLLAVHGDGLSPAQADALAGFLQRWTVAEGGVIRVRVPVRADRPGEAGPMARAARDFLVAQGAPAWRIETTDYDAAGAPATGAPLVVAFDRHQVETPLCGAHIENITRTSANKAMENFGCAITANLAAQVADPRDLLTPRTMDPADTQRRTTVLGKYREGELTASKKEEQAASAVAKTGN